MDYKITHTTVYSYSETVPICHKRCISRRASIRGRAAGQPPCRSPAAHDDRKPARLFRQPRQFFYRRGGARAVDRHGHQPRTRRRDAAAGRQRHALGSDSRRAGRRSQRALLDACQFAYDSPHVTTFPELAAYAAGSFMPGRPWLEAVLDLTRRIHTEFRYDQTATTVSTPLDEVLKLRRGVCQDFAHLEIGCLRCARSAGSLRQRLPRHVFAAGAAAADRGRCLARLGVGLFSPEQGWIDVDPTNDQIPSTKHVTLAWGRDYGDVGPIKGVFIGGGQHGMNVSVDVAPLSSESEA